MNWIDITKELPQPAEADECNIMCDYHEFLAFANGFDYVIMCYVKENTIQSDDGDFVPEGFYEINYDGELLYLQEGTVVTHWCKLSRPKEIQEGTAAWIQ